MTRYVLSHVLCYDISCELHCHQNTTNFFSSNIFFPPTQLFNDPVCTESCLIVWPIVRTQWDTHTYLHCLRVYESVCCGALQCVAVRCSVLQCVALRCNVLQSIAVTWMNQRHVSLLQSVAVCCSLLQSVAVCCGLLQFVVVYCSLLQSIAVCCSLLQSCEWLSIIAHTWVTPMNEATHMYEWGYIYIYMYIFI